MANVSSANRRGRTYIFNPNSVTPDARGHDKGAIVRSGKQIVIAVVIAVLIIAGGIFSYDKYSDWRAEREAQEAALKAAKKSVAEDTAGTEYFVKSTYDNSSMTYQQLFDRADDRLKKIGDDTISVKAGDLPKSQKAIISSYLDMLSNALEELEMQYRKGLAFSTSLDAMTSATHDYATSPYNEYSDQFERQRMVDAQSDASKAKDEFKAATKTFGDSLVQLQKFDRSNSSKMDGFILVDNKLLTSAIADNDKNYKQFN